MPGPGRKGVERRLQDLALAVRGPVEWSLSAALHGVTARKPDLLDRLGGFAERRFIIAPDRLPIAFEVQPSDRVRVRRRRDTADACAIVRGPLSSLLGVLLGASDADAAFFSRKVVIEGDTAAAVALHNTLEAADLKPSDFLPRPPGWDRLARAFRGARA